MLEERPQQDLGEKLNARWATYQMCGRMHASHLAGHARSEGHRRALRLLQDPGSVAGSPSTVAGSFPPVRKERHKYNAPSTVARSSEIVHEIVGSVAEPSSAHRRRHRNFDKHCPRCTWYKFESKWRHTCCSIRKEDQGSLQLRCWAQERPAHLGGTWALGCVVCSQAAQLLEERPK